MADIRIVCDNYVQLLDGWEEKISQTGHVFYINKKIGCTQWTHPINGKLKKVDTVVADGWEEQIDERNGRTIFYNTKNGRASTEDPRLLEAQEDIPQNIGVLKRIYDSSSTAMQVLDRRDLSGRVAVVTGANSGIGFETARSLALRGCEIVMACRDKAATTEAIEKITKESHSAGKKCKFLALDLSSLTKTKYFCDELKNEYKHIDYLILNAGVWGLPYSTTCDGVETMLQVNYLSNVFLTLSIESLFDRNSRIIIVASSAHKNPKLNAKSLTENNLNPSRWRFWTNASYNNSKLCSLIFAKELAKRWNHRGIAVFSVDPGNCVYSNIGRRSWLVPIVSLFCRSKTLQQAAASTVFVATVEELTGFTGHHFEDCFYCETSATLDELTGRLWNISEEMISRIVQGVEPKVI